MENPSSGMLWFLTLLLSLDKLSQYLSVRHREVDVMFPKAQRLALVVGFCLVLVFLVNLCFSC